jgi:hypothetical protein
MQTLTYLIAEMRVLGIKSLALELESPGSPAIALTEERTTLAPGEPDPDEPKMPDQCKAAGCGETRGGLFGGSVGAEYCRAHAAQRAGVAT